MQIADSFYNIRGRLITNPLIRGSFIMFIGSMVCNIANYVFNLLIGRILGPEDYGVLFALTSLLIVISVPSTTLTTTITKFTSGYKGRQENKKIAGLFFGLGKLLLFAGVTIFISFVFFSKSLALYLKIPLASSIIILGAMFLVNFPQTVNTGVLQGLQKFNFIAANSVLSVLIKVGLGVGLAWLGMGVDGAMLGILLSFLIPYFVSFWPLKFLLSFYKNYRLVDWKKIVRYAFPTFGATLGLTLFLSSDIVLVKRFFPSYEAGIYSSLALVSRTILFFSASVVTVMFALVAEKKAQNGNYRHYFEYSLLLVGASCLALTIFYTIFPRFAMWFFFGSKFLDAAPYLSLFSVFTSLYSICNTFILFYLSIQRTLIANLALLGAIAQAAGILLFHQTFWQVIAVSCLASGGLLIVLIIYYARNFGISLRLANGKGLVRRTIPSDKR